jgi:SAM-dependent methyltransferase
MTSDSRISVDVFLDEYSREEVIAKYLRNTAGAGIDYALAHVYAPVYSAIVKRSIAQNPRHHGFRVLEYGCGGGMNLFKVLDLFREQGAKIDAGVGVDFSPPMIEAARQEMARYLPQDVQDKVTFAVAANETLAPDLAQAFGSKIEDIERRFDVVVGVNTFRYSHRLQRETDCARDIFRLLRPGGYSVMIDMNRRFPLFRSKVSDFVRNRPQEEAYLPTLQEYTRPFQSAGFSIVERRNFCWIPHSASAGLVTVCRALAPLLDLCVPSFAMRSLVIAQRPG